MPRVLGLDLGSHSLKGVLLETTGRATSVLQYAETRRADEAPLDEALAVFLAENPWTPDQVVVALPGPSLATHVFTLPFTDTKRIAATLPFEVEGELPFELAQVVFDHQVTRRRANATDLVVGLVRREELAELLRTLSARGLDPRVVTHPAVAYQNLFIAAPERFEVAPDAAIAVIDIGHRRTSVAVGRPAEGLVFARTFPGGGRDLSRALATEFQVPLAEAETWKERDGSLAPGGGEEHERARAALLVTRRHRSPRLAVVGRHVRLRARRDGARLRQAVGGFGPRQGDQALHDPHDRRRHAHTGRRAQARQEHQRAAARIDPVGQRAAQHAAGHARPGHP